jgi:hypothetical protein
MNENVHQAIPLVTFPQSSIGRIGRLAANRERSGRLGPTKMSGLAGLTDENVHDDLQNLANSAHSVVPCLLWHAPDVTTPARMLAVSMVGREGLHGRMK